MPTRPAHDYRQADSAPSVVRESGIFRQCFEALVYLALAVILFRAFVAEGYMISTGSMAPCLLGYHRQVICPTCAFPFSRGTHVLDDDSILAEPDWSSTDIDFGAEPTAPATVCPNCGLSTIDVSTVPRNEGDQLLVQKHLYQLRPPRRWEVVVFRHPEDPDQAYVKRVVGLPGESIELRDGDLFADGRLQRKSLPVQQGMRITVYDHDHEPTDAEWEPRWRADADQTQWRKSEKGFVHHASGSKELAWLTYHHWIREGGSHQTSIPLADWPRNIDSPNSLDRSLSYSHDRRALEYVGVLSEWRAKRLRNASRDPGWIRAINELEATSHESPIVDLYGYNHPESSDTAHPIHDLMLEAVMTPFSKSGEFRVRMTDGWHWFETVLDFANEEVRLSVDDDSDPIRSAPLPVAGFGEPATVTVSLFDRQVLVCWNGQQCLEPLPYAAEARPRRLTSRPVQLGAAGIDLSVSHVRLYRDVHYTVRQLSAREAFTRLGPDEFFVLGDNSPVSVDSRLWESPAIPRELLVGKPFLVHLPSRQGRLEIAGDARHIRIPDFSRIRYIR